jgi:hypothetical protein
MAKKKLPPEIRDYFVKMGKQGGALGGHTRAANMTPQERSDSARNAVSARWARTKAKRAGQADGEGSRPPKPAGVRRKAEPAR